MHKTYLILGSVAIVLALVAVVFSSSVTGNFVAVKQSDVVRINPIANQLANKTGMNVSSTCSGDALTINVGQEIVKGYHTLYLESVEDNENPTKEFATFYLDGDLIGLEANSIVYKENIQICFKKATSGKALVFIKLIGDTPEFLSVGAIMKYGVLGTSNTLSAMCPPTHYIINRDCGTNWIGYGHGFNVFESSSTVITSSKNGPITPVGSDYAPRQSSCIFDKDVETNFNGTDPYVWIKLWCKRY